MGLTGAWPVCRLSASILLRQNEACCAAQYRRKAAMSLDDGCARLDDRVVGYDFSELDELVHAYAVSVHKSQGSEYRAVVLPVLTQHYVMLQRNLLYTAVTRAKELVVLVGSRRAIALAVRNNQVVARHTGLAVRLQT